MKKIPFFVSVFFFSVHVFAQNLSLSWVKATGSLGMETSTNVVQRSNGDVVIGGSYFYTVNFDPGGSNTAVTSAGSHDFYIARYGTNGNLVDLKSFGSSQTDELSVLKTDQSDNLYIAGLFTNTVDFDPSPAVNSMTTAASITTSFFAKYNNIGGYVFAKQINCTSGYLGITDMAVDNNGNVILVGSFFGNADFDPSSSVYTLSVSGPSQPYIAKYDPNGNLIFAAQLLDANTGTTNIKHVIVDSAGYIYINGKYCSATDFDPSASTQNMTCGGGDDLFFAKYDPSGNLVFAKSIQGDGSNAAVGALALDNNGNLYVSGGLGSTTGINFDPSSTNTIYYPPGGGATFYATYTSNGIYIGYKIFESIANGGVEIYKLFFDAGNNAYMTGAFFGTVDFDFSPQIAPLQAVSSSSSDIFIAKYDGTGTYQYCAAIASSGLDFGTDILTWNNSVFLTGAFRTTCDFDPSAGTTSYTSAGGMDIFVARYDEIPLGIIAENNNASPLVPNPFSDMIFLKEKRGNSFVTIVNEFGIIVLKDTIPLTGSIDTRSLPPGCYTVEISSGTQTTRSKMIKY